MISNRALLILSVLLQFGCASPGANNPTYESKLNGRHWFEQLVHDAETPLTYLGPQQPYLSQHLVASAVPSEAQLNLSALPASPALSPGDRVRIWLPYGTMHDGVFAASDEQLAGIFEINMDGTLSIPYLAPIAAEGMSLASLQSKIRERLVDAKIFKPGLALINVSIVEWAPITVFVSGAVFTPGQTTINVRTTEMRQVLRANLSGDFPAERMLPAALKAAGGVRPDANLRQVEIIRGNRTFFADLSGVLLGTRIASLPLQHGDMIRINSVGTPQLELMRPSAISPAGVRVYLSNLTRPAMDNAGSAIGKHATSLPYGSRLLTAIVSGNCAGGAVSTNSDRIAVLVTQDPLTHQPIAIERRIEALLRAPNRLDLNPYLLPEDSVVCYDSRVTNLREVSNTISDFLFPLSLILRGVLVW